jgi:hypothetical protein
MTLAERRQSITVSYTTACRSILDIDGIAFGEVFGKLAIFKFRGTRRIEALPTFPLQLLRQYDLWIFLKQ